MASERSSAPDWCERCGRDTDHDLLHCEGSENESPRPGEGNYVFHAQLRCQVCGAERDLRKTGDWDAVVAYLLEKRLSHWIPRLRRTRLRRQHVELNGEFLRQAPAFLRNIAIEVHHLLESGSAIEAASAVAFLLAAACEELAISGRGFSGKVNRLVMDELVFVDPEQALPIKRLTAIGDMRIHELIGLSRQELVESVRAIESILMNRWAMAAEGGAKRG